MPTEMSETSHSFKFAEGRPVWLLVRSDKKRGGKDMDAVFDVVRSRFGSKVKFIKLNWESDAGEGAIYEFSLSKPPASVIADAKGRVVSKCEHTRTAEHMAEQLKSLIEQSRKPIADEHRSK